MRVIVTRFFISTVWGNVEPGKVLDVSEARGKSLIENGLAKASPSDGSFLHPVEATVPQSSLQAAPASPNKIVKASEFGDKKATARKKK